MTQSTTLKDLSKEPRFKLEWNPEDFTRIKKAIVSHFRRYGITHTRGSFVPSSWKSVSECLGLAYTSSSSYAMYSVCNTEAYFDFGKKFKYECFGIDTHNNYYAILWDKDENEIIIPL